MKALVWCLEGVRMHTLIRPRFMLLPMSTTILLYGEIAFMEMKMALSKNRHMLEQVQTTLAIGLWTT